jgi:flagellar hook-associated protein 2
MTSLTISGIISGLDTTSIIDKLVAVEGNSQTLLARQQTAQKSAVSAYANMLSSVGELATQVNKLANTSTWATTTATSSSTTVTATATGKSAASLTFDVINPAAAHTLISAEPVTSTATTVASSGSLTLGKPDGTTSTIDVGNGTLAEVVAGINGAGAGLVATAVQTSPGQFRLQVGSSSAGAASQFTLDGLDGFTAMNELSTGANAKIKVGSGVNAYEIESTTNTFSNVVSGLSFTVSKEATGVTVSTTVDPTPVSDQISSIVTNANNLLASIAANTAWDSTTKTGGPLLGDSTVRSLQQGILSIVSSVATPGLSVTSGGQLAFDKDAFATAFTADAAAVASAYGSSSSFEAAAGTGATATYSNSTAATRAGSYAVQIASNATAEQWQIIPPGTGIVGRLITLAREPSLVTHTVADGEDIATTAASINSKLAAAGMGIAAEADSSGNLVFTASSPGTRTAFTASIDGGLIATQLAEGTDVAGTIDGVEGTGIGNTLTVPFDSGSDASGLSVTITASDADIASSGGEIGTITFATGLAQSLSQLFSQMSDSVNGQLVTAQAEASAQVTKLQTAIDGWTSRLNDYRTNLTNKFTAMESALASLKAQSSAMASFGLADASSDESS